MGLVMLVIQPGIGWCLANPAAMFCVKSGGKSEVRKGPRGEYGVCILRDGRVVDEWTYFRAMNGKRGNIR